MKACSKSTQFGVLHRDLNFDVAPINAIVASDSISLSTLPQSDTKLVIHGNEYV
jgi:hypothetical protein